MSRIDKLRISGIRSFGPDKMQEIKFTPPLTLILGQNGCGKTTIIEALKYITTGEMPPGCGRGAAFIHDPKIAREMMVRGQIRLRVITAAGEKVDFVRSMEVVQKPRSLEFKSLDQTITRAGADGNKKQASNKCVDFLHEIVHCVGVSKPILENVIFCHQEESNWPLDEGKKVKDKFDAIFNATKYIKCLETIRKLRTIKKTEIKNMHEVLAALKDMKEEADRKKTDLTTLQQQLDNIKQGQENIKKQKKPVLKRIQEIQQVEDNIAQVSMELGSKESRITMLQENNTQDTMEQSQVVDCTDSELYRRITEYQTTISINKTQIDKAERNISEANQELRLLSTRETEEQRRLAKLEAEQEQHETRLRQRSAAMRDIVTSNTVPALQAYSGRKEFGDEDADGLLQVLSCHITSQEEQLEDRTSDMINAEDAMQANLNTLRSREAALKQEVRGLDSRIQQLDSQLCRAKQELKRQRSEVQQLCDLETLSKQMQELGDEIVSKEREMDEQQVSSRIVELKTERGELTEQLDQLKRVVVAMNKQASTRSELDVHSKEIEHLSNKITQLFRKNKDTLEGLLPASVTEDTLKAEYDKCNKLLHKEMLGSKTLLDELKEKRSKNQVIVDSLRRQKEEKEKEIKGLEERISDACPDMPLEAAMSKKKEQLDSIQRETGELESTATVMERYVEKLTVEDCCPLCHRDFQRGGENAALRDELRGRLSNLPVRLRSAKHRLDATAKQYKCLLQLEPFREQLQEAQSKLRQIQSDLARPLSEISNLNAQVEECEMAYSVHTSDVSMCQAIQEDVVAADTHACTRLKLRTQCQQLRQLLGDEEESESLESLTGRVTALEKQLQQTSTELEHKQGQLISSKEHLVNLRNRRTTLAQKEIQIKTKQQAVEKKQEEMRRLEQEKQNEQNTRVERRKLLAPATEELQQEQNKKDLATARRTAYVKDAKAKLESLRELERPLLALQRSIRAHVASNNKSKLDTCQKLVNKVRQDVHDKQLAKKQCEDELRALEKQMLNHKEQERSLNTEKKIRERKREIVDLQTEVDLLKRKITAADEESLLMEKNKLIRQFNDLERQYNADSGRADELSSRIRDLQTDLQLPRFREAVIKYLRQMLHIKVMSHSCDDLNKYYVALDTAVMRFHREKMTNINRIVKHLWSTTYRGNDVDKIEIKTDESESKGADKRRTFNYRVVMVKRGVELDMRGRCSAGQKVLASLIIRMALAETFSRNCGILALDEPTTNLDRQNIESLAAGLINIVNERSQQRNFQLIVITHDNDFLGDLTNQADNIKSYYKVFRNRSGLSCIENVTVEGRME